MVMNSWKTSGIVNTPWMHPDVLPQVRSVMDLRHGLIPYLYTQMWRAAVEDVPPVRPLLWILLRTRPPAESKMLSCSAPTCS